MRRILIISVAVLASWLAPAAAQAASPTVSLADPLAGALITGSQPRFSGSDSFGSGSPGQVVIDVYSGTSTTGTPVQVPAQGASSGGFAAAATGLGDGTYTAQAVITDSAGDTAESQPATFQLFNGQPQLTLTAPPAPIQTAAPTFTGTAMTAAGDSQTAYLVIYAGGSTDATPVAVLPGTVGAAGAFSVPVQPGLPAGTYIAVATQQLASGTGFSASVPFTITSTAASLTVDSPAPGASEPQTGVVFSGTAGAAYGDSATVGLTLYRGRTAAGTPLGSENVTRSGTDWSETWPTALSLGTYTLRVTQDDIAGMATTVTHSFTVAPPGDVTGAISISRTGRLTAKLSCLDGAGTCQGDVLILTTAAFQPEYGGPRGRLALMFTHYSVRAGATATLHARLTPAQLAGLRAARRRIRLEVTVAYSVGAKLTEYSHVTRSVTVG